MRSIKLTFSVLTMLVLAGCNVVSSLNPISRKPVVDLSEFAASSSDYCPKIELRQGTESFSVYEPGFDGNRNKLVHQARIVKTARECTVANSQLQMRIGINGRVLAGPSSASSSTISVPVRIAVVRYQDAVVYSQLHPVSVQISEFDKSPEFVSVVNVTVPYPADERDFIIYVGFDRKDDS